MTINTKKLWRLFGVHEYRVISDGPCERTFGERVISAGCYYILNFQVCGKIKRRVFA